MYIPVFIGTSERDKLLKLPSDSIWNSVMFKNPGGIPPDSFGFGMLHMPMCFADYESTYHS